MEYRRQDNCPARCASNILERSVKPKTTQNPSERTKTFTPVTTKHQLQYGRYIEIGK